MPTTTSPVGEQGCAAGTPRNAASETATTSEQTRVRFKVRGRRPRTSVIGATRSVRRNAAASANLQHRAKPVRPADNGHPACVQHARVLKTREQDQAEHDGRPARRRVGRHDRHARHDQRARRRSTPPRPRRKSPAAGYAPRWRVRSMRTIEGLLSDRHAQRERDARGGRYRHTKRFCGHGIQVFDAHAAESELAICRISGRAGGKNAQAASGHRPRHQNARDGTQEPFVADITIPAEPSFSCPAAPDRASAGP